jgi:murein DD-endopeptidase MepM/ murein hydrolase activator NlpD
VIARDRQATGWRARHRRSGAALSLILLGACSSGRGTFPLAIAPLPATESARTAPSGAAPAHAGPLDARVSPDDLAALWDRQLMVPIDGMARELVRDTFTAPRSGGLHGALDLLAPRFTAVVAADDCVIGRLFTGSTGGIVIYASDPDERFVYYYAHLQQYRRGLAVGDRVAKGSVIGYVGTTGNAPPDTPHLHFQVMKRGAGRAWWDGPAINPFSFFALDGVRL